MVLPAGSSGHCWALRQLDLALRLLGQNADLAMDLQATLLGLVRFGLESHPLWRRCREARAAFLAWVGALASDAIGPSLVV